jgi:hypothetical protein
VLSAKVIAAEFWDNLSHGSRIHFGRWKQSNYQYDYHCGQVNSTQGDVENAWMLLTNSDETKIDQCVSTDEL